MQKSIALVIYTKNNEEYLKDFLFPSLLLPGINLDYKFHYYFYENDSTDKTLEVLETLAPKDITTIVSERDVFIPDSTPARSGREFGRINRIAAIRNRFLDKYRDELSAYDYVWFLDTDIFVCAEDIAEMLKVFETNRDVAMVTCNTIETIENTPERAELYGMPPPTVVPFITTNHYYDTYAFISIDNKSHYPNCISANCKYANCGISREGAGAIIIPSSRELIDVRSAWGGCVILHAGLLKEPSIRWNTFKFDEIAPCEHIYFCDMIRAFSKKRIVVASWISPFWIA